MTLHLDDTIAALASAAGPGARGIVRMSGPGIAGVLKRLFVPDDLSRFTRLRVAACHRGSFLLHDGRANLQATLYYWPTSRSYTGQPLAELHTIGSPPLLERALAQLFAHGARPAAAGEFTLRAFLAGRLDLVQAEAVLGVIDAHDQRELETALGQLAGGLSGELARVRGDLLDLLADVEAGLDFVDEDIEFIAHDDLTARLATARETLVQILARAGERMIPARRQRVVLAGLPNAGKSTLFNRLVGAETALVSEIKGTTRDYLSAPLDWNGTAVELIDTAGWEDHADETAAAQSAQSHRDEQTRAADLVIWCVPSDGDAATMRTDDQRRALLEKRHRRVLVVATKCDLIGDATGSHSRTAGPTLRISAQTGENLDHLTAAALSMLDVTRPGDRQFVGSTASRCRDSLAQAIESLSGALREADAGHEIIAIALRDALDHLGRILGAVYTDDILDRVFSRFCIGK